MATYAELLEENAELRRQVATLVEIVVGQQRRIEELERQIDELRRQGKRQAAPFSKGEPKAKHWNKKEIQMLRDKYGVGRFQLLDNDW